MKYLLPPFVFTSITNLWGGRRNISHLFVSGLRFYSTYVVVNEALLLLNISNGGRDGDVVRQLLKITESQKRFHCNSLKFKPSVDVMKS